MARKYQHLFASVLSVPHFFTRVRAHTHTSKYNSHTKKLRELNCTIQRFLVRVLSCATITTIRFQNVPVARIRALVSVCSYAHASPCPRNPGAPCRPRWALHTQSHTLWARCRGPRRSARTPEVRPRCRRPPWVPPSCCWMAPPGGGRPLTRPLAGCASFPGHPSRRHRGAQSRANSSRGSGGCGSRARVSTGLSL